MYVGLCWLCGANGTPSPAPDRQPANQITLAPGQQSTVDLYWASDGESCQWADWADFFVTWQKKTAGYLFVPSNWPMHICSAVRSAGYRPGAESPSTGGVKEGTLRVSLLQKQIYSDEPATLHVELTEKNPVENAVNCADLYTVRSQPAAGTRLDPLPTMNGFLMESFTPEQVREDKERQWPSWKKDLRRRCDIPGENTTADSTIAAETLANVSYIVWRTTPAPGSAAAFLSAAVHFTVLDPATLPPNWGEAVKGIQTGLSIDRDTYKTGELIPLHLQWKNVNATTELAQGECKDPWPVLEVQDAEHRVLHTVVLYHGCMGHGWGPFVMQRGETQKGFEQLGTEFGTTNPNPFIAGVKLPGPGTYYLVSVWSARSLDTSDENTSSNSIGPKGRIGGVYATARSLPVRVEVLP